LGFQNIPAAGDTALMKVAHGIFVKNCISITRITVRFSNNNWCLCWERSK